MTNVSNEDFWRNLTFILVDELLANLGDRISSLEQQSQMAKLLSTEGGSDPSVILKALEEIQKQLMDECNRKFTPLVQHDEVKLQLTEDINGLYKRISASEKATNTAVTELAVTKELCEANRKAI